LEITAAACSLTGERSGEAVALTIRNDNSLELAQDCDIDDGRQELPAANKQLRGATSGSPCGTLITPSELGERNWAAWRHFYRQITT
jgi:hypothetical protein